MDGTDPWAIDAEGRIFHEGRFVALIERMAEWDGRYSTSFIVRRVEVKSNRRIDSDPLFESSVVSTSGIKLSQEEWETLNATQATGVSS